MQESVEYLHLLHYFHHLHLNGGVKGVNSVNPSYLHYLHLSRSIEGVNNQNEPTNTPEIARPPSIVFFLPIRLAQNEDIIQDTKRGRIEKKWFMK